ncbi:MAG: tetratricopeptide repeat protein [Candidatus Obscuribacterales bacterium]
MAQQILILILSTLISCSSAVMPGSAVDSGLKLLCARSLNDQGIAELALEQKELAKESFSKAAQLSPTYASAQCNLGIVVEKFGDKKKALEHYNQALQLDANCSAAYFNRAGLREQAGEPTGALQDYDKSIAINPTCINVYESRAGLRQTIGDLNGTIVDCNQAIKLGSKEPLTYFTRGDARLHNGDNGGIKDLDKAITLDQTDNLLFGQRGYWRLQLKDYQGAIADCNRAIELRGDYTAAAYSFRGRALSLLNNSNAAMADCNKAVQLAPKLAGPYLYRAFVSEDNGNLKDAESDFTKAIQLEPCADAHTYRAQVRQELGDKVGSIQDSKTAMALAGKEAKANPN